MSILTHSTVNSISHSTFVNNTKDTSFEALKNAAAPSAFHSYVGRPEPGKCYPNTRVDLLRALETWSLGRGISEGDSLGDDHQEHPPHMQALVLSTGNPEMPVTSPDRHLKLPNSPIIWLNGGAGAGKSAVAQSFAERCEDLGHIVASFFFFSTDSTRNSANRLVASLAYQIARADPAARAHIEAVVYQDPHVFEQDFKKQIISLILNPVQMSVQAPNADGSERRCIIIIDGLDECTGDGVQAGIVRAISDALCTASPDLQQTLPRFLICSRPEEPIVHAFRTLHPQNTYTSVNLSSDMNAGRDIRTFLEGKFAEIKQTHRRKDIIPASWPADYDLHRLIWNSSGHFIYAHTIVRVVSNDSRPVMALEAILGLRASPQRVREPFAELDVLYQHILQRALEKSSMNTIRHVLGFMVLANRTADYDEAPPDLDGLAQFLDLEEGEMDTLLSTIPSLAFFEQHPFCMEISFYHKSFEDFLGDEFRAGEFYIADHAIYEYIWARCLDAASGTGNPAKTNPKFVIDQAFRCHRGYDFSGWKGPHSLLGMIQRRDFSTWISTLSGTVWAITLRYPNDAYSWAANCFKYWLELSRNMKSSSQLVEDATRIVIEIIKNLQPCLNEAAPLLMCQKKLRSETECYASYIPTSDPFKFLFSELMEIGARSQTDFSALERFLEDDQMGEYRLTAEAFAEGCLHWMTFLTKNVNLFPIKNKRVLQNRRILILNEAARRLGGPFKWRRTRKTVRPHRMHGRLNFLWTRCVFILRAEDGYLLGKEVDYGYTNRELFFGSHSNQVLKKESNYSLSEKKDKWRFSIGGRYARIWAGTKTTIRGYMKVRRHGGEHFFPRAIPDWSRFQVDTDVIGGRESLSHKRHGEDRNRKGQFRFILSRIPAMLARAAKSDAVAALRSKALPPFARRYPDLTRRAQEAMEEYAARHGYASPYIDPGPKYTAGVTPQEASISVNELVVSTAAPSGETVTAHLPLSTAMSTCGRKRRRPARSPLNHSNHPSAEICDEPGCETIISQRERSIICRSPDCNRKYHLECQGLTDIPAAEWFCDEECERDVAIRKRMRYKL
ncbi:hypothetical protein D9619_013654 [Psilocybe cf. subviscida]|uniref:Nephrocystin 3-like N-terminal domain-containing protein n=1 Tax=Psilocybe cf. subviscida TaxID=2480587 RepID=A0A8H5F8V5_9AGAR|nr:hypothetical protein D9619_013654 [Psilocybe cf. subviscida]